MRWILWILVWGQLAWGGPPEGEAPAPTSSDSTVETYRRWMRPWLHRHPVRVVWDSLDHTCKSALVTQLENFRVWEDHVQRYYGRKINALVNLEAAARARADSLQRVVDHLHRRCGQRRF